MISFPRRREIASAINTAASWFTLPLEMVPASASFLRDRFKHVHPARVNVSRRRIQNVRSLLMAGFRAEGITTKLAPYMTEMSPAWLTLWEMLEGCTYHRTELSRLFRYCSNEGIAPNDINDDVSAAYLDALETEALFTKPRTRHQSVCRVWNKCADLHQGTGWPQISLTEPRYDESSQQEAVTIIRSLIDRIEITPGEKRGDPQVHLVGGLAAILELAVSGQQKTTIQKDSGVGRVLLVAGAGFEPATFRL